MNSSPALLETAALNASYGHIRALRDIDVSIKPGRITAVVGANGAGKTTLLRVLIGAHRPSEGTVEYQAENITKWAPARRVAAGLVLVPERRGIIPGMTVADNMRLGLDAAGSHHSRDGFTSDDVYVRFPILRDRRNQPAGLLSGGEQQMLAIGRALLTQPNVLMLDEPSLGLSPKITQEVMRLLATLRDDGLTILLVEQNVRQAMKIADAYYLLGTGRVVASGDPNDAAGDSHIQAAYLGGN